MTVVSFEAERVSRLLETALLGFVGDPCDSQFQRGYLAALMWLYREGLGKGDGDDRLAILERQIAA